MKLEFTRDFEFYVDGLEKPVATFVKDEVITVLSTTQDDPHSYNGKVFHFGNIDFLKSETEHNFWVQANNGITVWTAIPMLIYMGVLKPVE